MTAAGAKTGAAQLISADRIRSRAETEERALRAARGLKELGIERMTRSHYCCKRVCILRGIQGCDRP